MDVPKTISTFDLLCTFEFGVNKFHVFYFELADTNPLTNDLTPYCVLVFLLDSVVGEFTCYEHPKYPGAYAVAWNSNLVQAGPNFINATCRAIEENSHIKFWSNDGKHGNPENQDH